MENIVDYKVKVGFGGRVKVVLSFASESPSLLGAPKTLPILREACDENDVVKDVPEAKSGAEASLDESILKDPAAEEAPAADTVDSDKAKAVFSAHAPSPTADFWSKLKRPTAGDIKGALKKGIPAAKSGAEASFGTKNDAALKPVTEDAPAFKPVTAGRAPLPSIKQFPAEVPAPAGIVDWTAPSNPCRNNGRKGEVKSTTVSNKYDLLDDVETNLAAENDGDEDEKKSKTPSTTHSGATVETTTTATPEGSVSACSASGWLSWPKLCWHNAVCAVFICLIAVSTGGGAFAYFSHGSDSLLPSIVPDATALPTERGPLFAPFNPTPDPVVPDVVESKEWLIATSGFCSNLNVAMIERDIKGSKTAGDRDGHFIADIEFNYYPQTAVKFTDAPHHLANPIEGDTAEADTLVSPAWDHKNIALLEPTSTCSVDQQSDQAWGISVFKVEEHRACADGETAWEGHPCVHFTGYVSAETSNFVLANAGRFVCQLFVDSLADSLDKCTEVCASNNDCGDGEKCESAWCYVDKRWRDDCVYQSEAYCYRGEEKMQCIHSAPAATVRQNFPGIPPPVTVPDVPDCPSECSDDMKDEKQGTQCCFNAKVWGVDEFCYLNFNADEAHKMGLNGKSTCDCDKHVNENQKKKPCRIRRPRRKMNEPESAGGGAFAYFSHGSDELLPSIVPDATALPTETERGPLFAPFNPTPDPPDVVNDKEWFIATSGFCSNLNVAMIERDIKGSKTAGDRDGHFIADIEFNYYPQTAVKFTDAPHHLANPIEGDTAEADALVSPAWDHKNIALLEPTSTCSVDQQSDQAWGISVFKVEEHRACTGAETAWEGHPCVHFTGYVSAETSNFVLENEGRFVCQLFVNSTQPIENPIM